MAWGTHKDRRDAVVKLAEQAEARAQEHRGREASYRTQNKPEKAAKHAATAARQERIATGHRQEIARLETRARQRARESLSTAERAHEMARAEERAAEAAAARPAVDPLQAYMEALATAAGLEDEVTRAEKRARGYQRAGDQGKAAIAAGGAARARERAAEWRDEADRIQAGTDRDLAREVTATVKARRRAESKTKNEAKRLADLGVVEDLTTAAAQREIASGGRGRGSAVASFRDYGSLIRKPQERTQVRLQTMERFDRLCGIADAGLFPELKLEHESSKGFGPGSLVMAARSDGLAEMSQISAAIGARNVEMLRAWIYERQTLVALARAGFGTEKTAGALALAALDALIVFAKTRSALAARMAGMGTPLRARPSGAASAGPAVCPPPGSDSGNSNSPDSQASPNQPGKPQPASGRLPANARPPRQTISCPEPISDDARRTIQARLSRPVSSPDLR